MFNFVRLTTVDGVDRKLFIDCSDSGYSAKDLLTVPGAYEELFDDDVNAVKFMQLVGKIGDYTTECFAIVLGDTVTDVNDITSDVVRILSIPETAAKSLMASMPPDRKAVVSGALDTIRYYESVKLTTKVCLPIETLSELPADVREKMASARKHYVLKAVDNVEVFQKSFDAPFCIQLPTIEELHPPGTYRYNALDLLRVTMPYRRPGTNMYNSVYHTPFYRYGVLNGSVPKYLSWLEGFSGNDMLDIQPNERKMFNNLYTLYCADIERYTASIVSGVFFYTKLGSLLMKLVQINDSDAINSLLSDIAMANSDKASCHLGVSQVETLQLNGWQTSEVAMEIQNNVQIADGYIEELLNSQLNSAHIVDTDRVPFVLNFEDAELQKYADMLIAKGYITFAMRRLLNRLCQYAYQVNWGHTGTAKAIPDLIMESNVAPFDTQCGLYLADATRGQAEQKPTYNMLYAGSYGDVEVEAETEESENPVDDGDVAAFEFYITKDTFNKIRLDALSPSFFTTHLTAADSQEAHVIERWRDTPGCSNIVNFLLDAYNTTSDVKVFIQAFIKLMRWGDRRPKLLVLSDHPEVRTVFDLGNGVATANTVIVDENDLVKTNGCTYSFAGFLCSNSNAEVEVTDVIGFILQKNYGTVKRDYLASWTDLGEMVANGAVDIGEFKAMTPMNITPDKLVPIEEYEKKAYQLYESDANISAGLQLKIPGRELSELVLLTRPGITGTTEYMRSLRNQTIVTTRDRQYDILRRYLDKVSEFNKAYRNDMLAVGNSIQLLGIISEYNGFKTSSQSKPEHNDVMSGNALAQMDIEADDDKIIYDNGPLTGKFMLVFDDTGRYPIEGIQFTNPTLQNISKQLRNRIVYLVCNRGTEYIICRKDIDRSELALVNTNREGRVVAVPNNRKLFNFLPCIERLKKGQSATINNIPVKIHESCRGYM